MATKMLIRIRQRLISYHNERLWTNSAKNVQLLEIRFLSFHNNFQTLSTDYLKQEEPIAILKDNFTEKDKKTSDDGWKISTKTFIEKN